MDQTESPTWYCTPGGQADGQPDQQPYVKPKKFATTITITTSNTMKLASLIAAIAEDRQRIENEDRGLGDSKQ